MSSDNNPFARSSRMRHSGAVTPVSDRDVQANIPHIPPAPALPLTSVPEDTEQNVASSSQSTQAPTTSTITEAQRVITIPTRLEATVDKMRRMNADESTITNFNELATASQSDPTAVPMMMALIHADTCNNIVRMNDQSKQISQQSEQINEIRTMVLSLVNRQSARSSRRSSR